VLALTGSADVASAVLALTGSADVVFELVGREATLHASIKMLARWGRYVLIGYSADTLQIHPIDLIVRVLRLLGSVGATLQDTHDVVDLVSRGAIRSFVDRTSSWSTSSRGLPRWSKVTRAARSSSLSIERGRWGEVQGFHFPCACRSSHGSRNPVW
jgi:D-arabinose 1-dehydrogenase-like Zn-dependent alcohol dehydrogenase